MVVIFGASGDLTKRKLIPAILNLQNGGFPPAQPGGGGRGAHADDPRAVPRRGESRRQGALHRADAGRRGARCRSGSSTSAADATKRRVVHRSRRVPRKTDAQVGTPGNYLFYLSVSPRFFAPIVQNLGKSGLAKEENGRWRRVIIEKPFGHDLPSAVELNRNIKAVHRREADLPDRPLPREGDGPEPHGVPVRERDVRADLEPQLHRPRADHRCARSSASRDAAATTTPRARCGTWCPNHIAQLVSLVGMEPPISFSADAVRDEQVKLLNSVEPLSPEEVLAAGGARASTARVRSTGSKVPGLPRGGQGPARQQHRDVRRAATERR